MPGKQKPDWFNMILQVTRFCLDVQPVKMISYHLRKQL